MNVQSPKVCCVGRTKGYIESMATLAAMLCLLLLDSCSALQVSEPVPDPNLLEAIRWYTGESGRVDDARARILLETANSDDDVLSRMWLARVYSTGRMTYPADKVQAISLAGSVMGAIEQLAVQGIAEAEFLLGTAYAEGLAKNVDPVLAASWYHRAALQGHTLALHNMGNIHASGTGVTQDDAEAVRWWLLAADKGDAIPQLRLGEMYEQGRGVERDLSRAMQWYEAAASRGNQNAAVAVERLR